MSHEVCREIPGRLLQAKLGRYGLKFLDECVSIIATDILCAIVDDGHFAGRIIVRPRTDIFLDVWRDIVETNFEQYAFLQAFQCRAVARVSQPYAAAEIIGKSIECGVAFGLIDVIDGYRLGQVIVVVLAALSMRVLCLIATGFYRIARRRVDPDIQVFRKSINNQEAL